MQHLRIKTCEMIFMNCQPLKEHAIYVLYSVFKFNAILTHKIKKYAK